MWISIGAAAVAASLTAFVLLRPGKDKSSPDGPDSPVARIYDPPQTYKPTPADAEVREKLKSNIASLHFSEVELGKVIDELREISGVRIRVNWPALAKQGVTPEAAVNIRLKDVTLDKAIRVVLSDFSDISPDGANRSDLGHVVEDGAITISSEAELADHKYAWEYDVSDLVDLFSEYGINTVDDDVSGLDGDLRSDPSFITDISKSPVAGTPDPELEAVFEALARGDVKTQIRSNNSADLTNEDDPDSTDSGLFDPADPETRPMTRPEIAQEISLLVSGCVDDESCRQSGGYSGKIRQDGEKLVVTQSNSNHQAIAGVLGKLRAGLKNRTGDSGGEKTIESASRTGELLDLKIPGREFQDAELREVIQYVREESGANIHVRWRVMTSDAIEPETRISIRLKDSTLGEALEAICRNITSDFESGVGLVGPDYVVGDNVITISLKGDLLYEMSVGVYDVSKIVSLVTEYEDPQEGRSEAMDGAKTLVAETFSLACWCDFHKGLVSIRDIGGLLVVVRAAAHHESITRLLEQLHAHRRGEGPKTHKAIRIAGLSHMPKQCVLRTYDIRDIIEHIPPEACRFCLLHDHGPEGPGEVRQYASVLIDSVVSSIVDRDSWLEVGGEFGRTHAIGGALVVTQTIANHNAIEELLGNIRRHFKTPNLDARTYIETPADRIAGKQLDVKISELDLAEVELKNALSALCAAPGVDLSVNHASLAKHKDEVYRKVNVCLTDVTVKEALDCILGSITNVDGSGLGYLIRDGRIELIPSGDSPVSVRIYDVRSLVASARKHQDPSGSREWRLRELSMLITNAVDFDSWADAGDESGIIRRLDGLLLIRQTTANHEAIAELLEWLKAYFKADKLEPYLPLATRTERLICRKLAQETTKLEFDNIGFARAIQTVVNAAGLTKHIGHEPLDTFLASRKISLKLKNVTFREALDAVFASVKDEFGFAPEYIIRRGVMKINYDLLRGGSLVVRIYDIRDIIARKMKPTKLNPEGYEEHQAARETVEAIETLVREAAQSGERESQHANTFLGMLVVNETEKKHASLAALLEKLRAEK